jgi:hypothetical protein
LHLARQCEVLEKAPGPRPIPAKGLHTRG